MDKKRRLNADKASAILGSLSHPTRLLIVCLLLERERFAGELLDELGSTKGNISQHLRILQAQGHLASRKEANRVYYRIADARLGQLVATLQRLYCPGLTAH